MTTEELSAHQPPLTDGGAQALAWLRQMRTEKPVYFNEAMQGWFVYRHADAVHLLSDHRTFSELRSFAALLLLAGHVTTTALLGNTWLCLEENPDARSQVQKDPSLLPAAIDEVMRCRPSLTMAVRVPNEDVVLHGHEIAKNTMVYASLLSANRDERAFRDPDVFDIHRPERHHLSFGHGIHYCLGAPLAKQKVEIVYRSLLTRFPTIHRDPSAPLEFWETPGIFAPARISRPGSLPRRRSRPSRPLVRCWTPSAPSSLTAAARGWNTSQPADHRLPRRRGRTPARTPERPVMHDERRTSTRAAPRRRPTAHVVLRGIRSAAYPGALGQLLGLAPEHSTTDTGKTAQGRTAPPRR